MGDRLVRPVRDDGSRVVRDGGSTHLEDGHRSILGIVREKPTHTVFFQEKTMVPCGHVME